MKLPQAVIVEKGSPWAPDEQRAGPQDEEKRTMYTRMPMRWRVSGAHGISARQGSAAKQRGRPGVMAESMPQYICTNALRERGTPSVSKRVLRRLEQDVTADRSIPIPRISGTAISPTGRDSSSASLPRKRDDNKTPRYIDHPYDETGHGDDAVSVQHAGGCHNASTAIRGCASHAE